MRRRCTVDNMSELISDSLQDYSDAMQKASRNAVDKAMRQMVKQTKKRGGKTGKYKSAIASKVTKNSNSNYGKTWYVKYPRTGVAHLLNNGHENHYNGSFVGGDNHITVAAIAAAEKMEKIIKEAAQNA